MPSRLVFDFSSSGADRLKSNLRGVSDTSVLAARGARLLSDALEKERKGAAVSASASLALAKADKILEEAEHGLAEGALEAEFALKKQADAARDAAGESAAAGVAARGAGGGFSALASPMGAAVAAGVALSPVIATLGVGLGGLGLAAVGVAKNQQLMAAGLAPLKADYAAFQKALQPVVLQDLAAGLGIARHGLHDLQPVAQATGKALGVMLGQVDRASQSGTWKQFFGFMASTAGPDMQLLTNNFVDLAHALPPILEDLQPLATGLLGATDNAAKLAGAVASFGKSTDKTSNSVGTNVGVLGFLSKAVANVTSFMKPGGVATGALNEALAGIPGNTGKAAAAFQGTWPKAQSYAQWVQASATATRNLANAQNAAVSAQLAYGSDILTSANDAQTFREKLRASTGQIGLHTQAQRDSFGAANTYIGDLGRQATSAIASGHGTDAAIAAIRGGLPALDSAKTKNKQYWQEVRTLVSYLNKLELIKFISTPIHVTGTGKWSVTGTTVTPGVAHGPQNIGAAPGAAAGLFINRGTGPAADDVMIRASRGELIVPANMVKAGLADHLRGMIPGFAAGGVAGSYGPAKVSGLPRWTAGRINATDTAISRNTAQAILNAMAAAQKAARAQAEASKAAGLGNLPLGLGPHSGSAAVAQAFAKSILWAYGWGTGQFPPLQALWNQESGWNSYAVNPSSGAYGIPQALGHGHPYNLGDYQAQIRWGLAYIKQRYGSPAAAEAHELAYHWYARGGLVPGYAAGGQVSSQGAAWLKAWQSRHGGGFGAAWGPVAVNQQIAEMAAAVSRAKALAGAKGLSAGQHRFWAASAADEKKRLGVLGRELTTGRAWRYQLGLGELGLDKEIRAAGSLKSLAGPVRGWKAQLSRDKATVAAISKMLGYSDAYLAAHPAAKPGPVLPTVTHTYGGDVANNLGAVLASALGPFTGAARGGMVFDRGGTLRPGWNATYNGTGRPESLVPASGGGGSVTVVLENHGVIGSQQQLEDWLMRTLNKAAQHGRLTQAVNRAYSPPGGLRR